MGKRSADNSKRLDSVSPLPYIRNIEDFAWVCTVVAFQFCGTCCGLEKKRIDAKGFSGQEKVCRYESAPIAAIRSIAHLRTVLHQLLFQKALHAGDGNWSI